MLKRNKAKLQRRGFTNIVNLPINMIRTWNDDVTHVSCVQLTNGNIMIEPKQPGVK